MKENKNRFTDNLNGTVTDNLTKLVWLKDANVFGKRMWKQALQDANTLASGSAVLTDGSKAGDWRLPNLIELESLVGFTSEIEHAFTAVQSYYYWSSTTYSQETTVAWYVYLQGGNAYGGSKTGMYYVWPVRAR